MTIQMNPLSHQSGVALITALLITALVTVAAVSMASRQQLDMRRTGNMLEADQAYMYALGGETFAKLGLQADGDNSTIDTLQEDWNTPLPPTIVEGGAIAGGIKDLNGRFNLNNLIDTKGEADEAQTRAFQRILEQISGSEEDVDFSPFMANRVVDWIDPDLNALADGAEDLEYLSMKIPYRAANRFMVSPSELIAISGFQEQGGNRGISELLNVVTSLPELTRVNVNTASNLVLMSLHEDIDERIADEVISQREDEPFEDVQDFSDLLETKYDIVLETDYVNKFLSVESDYFLVTIDASIGRTQLRLYSVLLRRNNKVITQYRSIGIL